MNGAVIGKCGEHQDLDAGKLRSDALSRLKAIHYRHLNIQEYHIRFQTPKKIECFRAIGCTPHNMYILILSEQDRK